MVCKPSFEQAKSSTMIVPLKSDLCGNGLGWVKGGFKFHSQKKTKTKKEGREEEARIKEDEKNTFSIREKNEVV